MVDIKEVLDELNKMILTCFICSIDIFYEFLMILRIKYPFEAQKETKK
jgi:H+/gluconate symporter-like permease